MRLRRITDIWNPTQDEPFEIKDARFPFSNADEYFKCFSVEGSFKNKNALETSLVEMHERLSKLDSFWNNNDSWIIADSKSLDLLRKLPVYFNWSASNPGILEQYANCKVTGALLNKWEVYEADLPDYVLYMGSGCNPTICGMLEISIDAATLTLDESNSWVINLPFVNRPYPTLYALNDKKHQRAVGS